MTSIAEKYAAQFMPNGEVSLADLIQAAVDEATDKLRLIAVNREVVELQERIHQLEAQSVPALSVWYGAMPETNGKSNWTALLHNGDFTTGITIARSEYPDRVRYEADCVRYLIGELKDEPFILDYDAEKHSGYVKPQSVPVVGEPVAWVNEYCIDEWERSQKDNWSGARLTAKEVPGSTVPLFRKPTHAITAAELATLREKAAMVDELRKDAARYQFIRALENDAVAIQLVKSECDVDLDDAIDAAIAQEQGLRR